MLDSDTLYLRGVYYHMPKLQKYNKIETDQFNEDAVDTERDIEYMGLEKMVKHNIIDSFNTLIDPETDECDCCYSYNSIIQTANYLMNKKNFKIRE